jgi:hypothetical protein
MLYIMKVAFCLYGLSGGFSERIESRANYSHTLDVMKKSYESYKKNIFEANKDVNFDVYFHTRKHKNIETIINMYNPRGYIVEDKQVLNERHKPWNIAVLSRHDSVSKVLDLVKEEYDYIFLCRFDVTFLNPLKFNNLNLTKNQLYFSEQSHVMHNGNILDTPKYYNNCPKNISWKKNDKTNYLNDWWMIFRVNMKETVINMETSHKNHLTTNIHKYMANYFSKHGEIVLSDLRFYDTPLTRYILYGKV